MVFINVFVFYGNQVFRKIIFVVCWKNKFKFQQKVTKKLQIFSPLFVKKIFPIAMSIDILSCWSKLLHLFWHLSGRFFCCLQNNFWVFDEIQQFDSLILSRFRKIISFFLSSTLTVSLNIYVPIGKRVFNLLLDTSF